LSDPPLGVDSTAARDGVLRGMSRKAQDLVTRRVFNGGKPWLAYDTILVRGGRKSQAADWFQEWEDGSSRASYRATFFASAGLQLRPGPNE